MIFELERHQFIDTIREFIKSCQSLNHIQQVAYSTYHDSLTQICFTCKKIRTNLKDDLPADKSESMNKKDQTEEEIKKELDKDYANPKLNEGDKNGKD